MNKQFKTFVPFCYFIFLFFIVFINNERVSLWDQDEAAYAGFAKQMVETGNWLVPNFMWSEIHRKTPLHFWDIALSYKIFGINEFAVRFPSALFTFLTYLLIYFAGRPLFGRKIAFLSVVVLSTTLFIPSLAKVSVTDATLLFYSTVCAFSLLYIIEKRSFIWVLFFWVSFAMALLTKGPPVILFTGVMGGILLLFHPKRKNLIILHPWFFLPVAFVPLFVWGYLVSERDSQFIAWLIDWYILKRVNGGVLGQTGPPGIHLLSFFIFFIPYFMFFPKAFWLAASSIFKKDKGINFLLSSWFIAGWFLYEWSPSKLPAYVIAAHIPLAILTGKQIFHFIQIKKRPVQGLFITHFILMFVIFTALIVAPLLLDLDSSLKFYFIATGLVLILSIIATIYYRNTVHFSKMLIGTNLLFQALLWIVLLPEVDSLRNGSKRIANFINKNADKSSTVMIANNQGHPPSLPFYLSLNFGKINEESNLDMLISSYKSNDPFVLILTKELRDKTEALIPEAKFTVIQSMLTDRKENSNYYILINDSGRKNVTSESDQHPSTTINVSSAKAD
jgi:4-amino-4-deoxy-L-arabinose transferase-like glycosyltransferase